ncbi:MAG: hypothetical protein K2G55_00365 [Lachnospiraceae bacterium]|nr:hypothetical protein [Lachnospiraceae bacterium]MDE7204982.1 hypothetical protein [Lachnospiraceae bacterium]
MGHCIRAIIGVHESVQKLAEDWVYAEEIELLQGYGMVFLTNALLDDITELYDVPDEFCFPELDYFTVAAEQLLQQYSFRTKLAYVETDYFGGVGTQAGVLYENGRISIEPRSGDGTINLLLKELGVWCRPGKDAFDSLNLGRYRRMPE